MSNIVDKIEDKVRGEKKVKATKITVHYENELQMEVWFEGPHAAAGWVLDLLLGHTESDLDPLSITVVPNAQDVPTHSEG